MRRSGFTLIEMMIVVALVATLGLAAWGAYRKYMDHGRKAEVLAMFGEIRMREEAYRNEYSQYVSTTTTTSETDFWPVVDSCPAGQSEPCAKTWSPPGGNWTSLGINPGRASVYCGYDVIAGGPGLSPSSPTGTRGTAWYPTTPTTLWWYAIGSCDNDGDPGANAQYSTSVDSTVVWEQDIHK